VLSDSILRLIRTYVPILIGAAVSRLPFLADLLDTAVIVPLVIAGYYGLAALLENKVWDGFGWLLGHPKA